MSTPAAKLNKIDRIFVAPFFKPDDDNNTNRRNQA